MFVSNHHESSRPACQQTQTLGHESDESPSHSQRNSQLGKVPADSAIDLSSILDDGDYGDDVSIFVFVRVYFVYESPYRTRSSCIFSSHSSYSAWKNKGIGHIAASYA